MPTSAINIMPLTSGENSDDIIDGHAGSDGLTQAGDMVPVYGGNVVDSHVHDNIEASPPILMPHIEYQGLLGGFYADANMTAIFKMQCDQRVRQARFYLFITAFENPNKLYPVGLKSSSCSLTTVGGVLFGLADDIINYKRRFTLTIEVYDCKTARKNYSELMSFVKDNGHSGVLTFGELEMRMTLALQLGVKVLYQLPGDDPSFWRTALAKSEAFIVQPKPPRVVSVIPAWVRQPVEGVPGSAMVTFDRVLYIPGLEMVLNATLKAANNDEQGPADEATNCHVELVQPDTLKLSCHQFNPGLWRFGSNRSIVIQGKFGDQTWKLEFPLKPPNLRDRRDRQYSESEVEDPIVYG